MHNVADTMREQKNSRWEDSIALSKQDKLFKDAMVTAAVSGEVSVAEELLSYFVDIGNKDCFAATLYVCFDLLRPDVVAELVSSRSSCVAAYCTHMPLFSPGDMV
jgi:hypothetical protein